MKLKKYKVSLFATLPCSAYLYVDAKNEEEAKDIAEQKWSDADWMGPDYNHPSGCDVEVGEAEEVG